MPERVAEVHRELEGAGRGAWKPARDLADGQQVQPGSIDGEQQSVRQAQLRAGAEAHHAIVDSGRGRAEPLGLGRKRQALDGVARKDRDEVALHGSAHAHTDLVSVVAGAKTVPFAVRARPAPEPELTGEIEPEPGRPAVREAAARIVDDAEIQHRHAGQLVVAERWRERVAIHELAKRRADRERGT
jgi:hypothetical protein